MKTHRLNRVPSLVRIFAAGALVSAAAAMAFVAVKTSAPTSPAKISMSRFRALQEALETSLGATRSGEPDPSAKGADVSKKISKIHNGRAQQRYDDQAYPATYIQPAQQQNALNAANAIGKLPGGKQSQPKTDLLAQTIAPKDDTPRRPYRCQ